MNIRKLLELQADTLCWPTLHKHCLYRNRICTLSRMWLRVFTLHSHSVTLSASNKAIWLSGRVGNLQHQVQGKHQLLWKSSKVILYALLVHTLCAFVNMLVLWVYRERERHTKSQTLCMGFVRRSVALYVQAFSSLYQTKQLVQDKTKYGANVATSQLLISMCQWNI